MTKTKPVSNPPDVADAQAVEQKITPTLESARSRSPGPLSPSGFPPFMRPADLAARLSLKPKTLAEYRVTGEGPEFIKAGPRLCLYTAAAVEAWLAKGRRTSTSAGGG